MIEYKRGLFLVMESNPIPFFNKATVDFSVLKKEWSDKNETVISDYAGAGYKKVWWKCLAGLGHDDYLQPYVPHLMGNSCPVCGYIKRRKKVTDRILTTEGSLADAFPELVKDWDYSKNDMNPTNIHARQVLRVNWKCHTCSHQWETLLHSRAGLGTGCPNCWSKRRKGIRHKPVKKTFANDFPQLVPLWSSKNDKLHDEIKPSSDYPAWWKCENNLHEDYQRRCDGQTTTLIKSGCPVCNRGRISNAEAEIIEHLEDKKLNIVRGSRKIIAPQELDIYLPDYKVAIEYNGIYWHTENRGKSKWYHYEKMLACREQGIQLIQVWEDDWNSNKSLILNMIDYKLGLFVGEKISARNTKVIELNIREAQTFLNLYHIQGFASGSHYLGLVDKSDLSKVVSVLVVKNEPKTQGKTLNIIRYATSCSVVGGFTKLLSYAEKAFSPERFITFSDNCVSDGSLYASNGFVKDKELAPDYSYFVKNRRKHKFGYRVKAFRDNPELKYVEGYTESQLAELNELHRIWDAGKARWVKESNSSTKHIKTIEQK